jgi:hypothetical protein
MQALTTSDYRGGGFQWPQSQEDEEDSYPLYVPIQTCSGLVLTRLQPASDEGPFSWVICHIWRQHSWWRTVQVLERRRPTQSRRSSVTSQWRHEWQVNKPC